MGAGDVTPISDAEFAAAMTAVGPFERAPGLAVAVSGGADSMALCLLADGWARCRGGTITALTVDHGLRAGSFGEAERVGRWMAARGIDHRILRWTGAKPIAGIQATAREARYEILSGWCREAGVLHLLLGHHLRDQAETVLIRALRGSGVDGLAAMAAIVETPSVRLLRPILNVAPARLRATLDARRQCWIDDPSNRDPAFTRSRVRRALLSLAEPETAITGLAAVGQRMGRARVALEQAVSALLAHGCRLHAAGYAHIDAELLRAASEEVASRALARLLAAIGGGAYAPGAAMVERVYAEMIGGGAKPATTVANCRLLRDRGGLLICREQRNLPAPGPVVVGQRLLWDGRFLIGLVGDDPDLRGQRLTALADDGWRQIVDVQPALRRHPLPLPVRLSLPALADDEGIVDVPHLGYRRSDATTTGMAFDVCAFRPQKPISGPGYFLVGLQ